MSKQSIEQRIASMLNSNEATAKEIESLLTETEQAITAADAAITKTREAALDPIQMPDANKARVAVEDVYLRCPALACAAAEVSTETESGAHAG